METEMLENGEVMLPEALRRRLGIKLGDTLDVQVKDGEIILSPRPKPDTESLDKNVGSYEILT